MAKFITFFILALLFCSTLTYAARPEPPQPKAQQVEAGESHQSEKAMDEICEGVGEEECLMRRTLVAHTDYIYTQEHKP
ncbi:phytosulfokines 3-like [Rutidosis leptorrhynchoides]|uniref:phytosulfokines 3-like n=1 Tax=Rutidosis leptorrhynchoides TaxID=125765 RepID=UPI003A998D63